MSAKVRYSLLSVCLLGTLALTPFRVVKVSGNSMLPTLRNGEAYLLDQYYWRSGGLRRGDIVVVRHGEEKWVKRLVGMPGDRLQIRYRGDGWITQINNVTANPSLEQDDGLFQDRQVGPDEIFVVGDNLNWSADSTNQEAGAFRLRDVIGIVRTFRLKREFAFRKHQ